MKAVDFLVNSALPEDLRDYSRKYDKKGMTDLLNLIANTYPDRYEELSKKLQDLGRDASYTVGSTITLDDFDIGYDKRPDIERMKKEIDLIERNVKNEKEKELKKLKTYSNYSNLINDSVLESAKKNPNNGLANIILSGARGSPSQLRSIVATPAMFTDYQDKVIPMFVENSYADGLSPHEYAASVFGVRKGVIATKESTQDAGYVGKMATQASADQLVTSDDCGTHNGISLQPDDETLVGRVLRKPSGGFPAGTVVDRKTANKIRNSGDKNIIVGSPLTCEKTKGMCAKCHGTLPGNKELPPVGYEAGITAANAIFEPLAQASLNTKHEGGSFSGDKKEFAGLSYIEQVLQSPEEYPSRAAVSEVDGKVEKIEKAPQGGTNVYIDNQKHYISPEFEPTVKEGDEVEAGNALSDGLLDVEDIARTRGIGEARNAFVSTLGQVLSDSKIKANKRNLETFARSAVNHVKINDFDDEAGFLPGDITYYNDLSGNYTPSQNAKRMAPSTATEKYLEQPALHYSIGTKLKPSMVKNLEDSGIDEVYASDTQPKFDPFYNRVTANKHNDPDFLVRLSTSYLKSNLNDAATKGLTTDVENNTHFAPPLIGNSPNFGNDIKRKGTF